MGILGICTIYWGLCLPCQEGSGCLPVAAPLCGHGLAGAHKRIGIWLAQVLDVQRMSLKVFPSH